MAPSQIGKNRAYLAILVAALGYFVDVFDLILFSILRVPSLQSLGFAGEELLSNGVFLLNMQMSGMLLGGILWGIWGDKRGRVSVLFGSIFLYSAANVLNGFVDSIPGYAVFRFLAGIGLAGELGAGITLVCESLPKETRGYGTTAIATIGVAGALAAAYVGEYFDWRTAYFIGGGLGLLLLFLRVLVHESGLFALLVEKDVPRGSLLLLVSNKARFLRYLACIFIGLPVWCVIGIIVTFCPEIGKALSMPELPQPAKAVFYSYVGLVIGDLISGLLSQYLRSRKKAVIIFLFATLVFGSAILSVTEQSTTTFYALCIPLGIAVGYWAVFVTTASEQFGTNLRATVTTTVPNFVRGATVIFTLLFNVLKDSLGVRGSAFAVLSLSLILAFVSIIRLRESFGHDLDFLES